jgi:integrase/recombinase XerD
MTFENFVKEQKYLKGVTEKTIAFYRQSFKAFNLEDFSKESLNKRVMELREGGMKPVTINTYIRGMNSFLSWSGKERIKQLKTEKKIIGTFEERDLKRIISFRPGTFTEFRIHALVLLALDTGCRINELLNLKRNSADLENLLVRVVGKGNKERVIPISFEARKTIFQLLKRHEFNYVFCTKHGGSLMYNNVRRDYLKLLKKCGVEKCEKSFHALRRAFAKHYVSNGGNLFYLQKAMGHQDLSTTRRYVELNTEDLQKAHRSILSKF